LIRVRGRQQGSWRRRRRRRKKHRTREHRAGEEGHKKRA